MMAFPQLGKEGYIFLFLIFPKKLVFLSVIIINSRVFLFVSILFFH